MKKGLFILVLVIAMLCCACGTAQTPEQPEQEVATTAEPETMEDKMSQTTYNAAYVAIDTVNQYLEGTKSKDAAVSTLDFLVTQLDEENKSLTDEMENVNNLAVSASIASLSSGVQGYGLLEETLTTLTEFMERPRTIVDHES